MENIFKNGIFILVVIVAVALAQQSDRPRVAPTTVDIFAPTAPTTSLTRDITPPYPPTTPPAELSRNRAPSGARTTPPTPNVDRMNGIQRNAAISRSGAFDDFRFRTTQMTFQPIERTTSDTLMMGSSSTTATELIQPFVDRTTAIPNFQTTIDIFAPTVASTGNRNIPAEIPKPIPAVTDKLTSSSSVKILNSKTKNDMTINTDIDIISKQTEKNEKCPKFTTRYVADALVLDLYSPAGCQMVVTIMDITPLFKLFSGSPFWEFLTQRRVKIPSVGYRRIRTISKEFDNMTCPKFPVDVVGSRVVVNTVPGVCKIVFSTKTFQTGSSPPNDTFNGSFTKGYRSRPVLDFGNDGKS